MGYLDAHEYFAGRARWVALGVTAFVMATGQSGGLPDALDGQAVLLAALFVVNLALAGVMASYGQSIHETNDRRARAITELEAVNADLQQALAENARLHETVVEQARQAGIQQERARLAGRSTTPSPSRWPASSRSCRRRTRIRTPRECAAGWTAPRRWPGRRSRRRGAP